MTMPTQDTSARRPIAPGAGKSVARDLLAPYMPPHQPRAVLPNRVFRGG